MLFFTIIAAAADKDNGFQQISCTVDIIMYYLHPGMSKQDGLGIRIEGLHDKKANVCVKK